MRLRRLNDRRETFVVQYGDSETNVWTDGDRVEVDETTSPEDALALARRIADGIAMAGVDTRIVLRRAESFVVVFGASR